MHSYAPCEPFTLEINELCGFYLSICEHSRKNFPLLPTGEVLIQLPLTDPATLFAELVQDLPAETMQMARACKAFVRAKKVKMNNWPRRCKACMLWPLTS